MSAEGELCFKLENKVEGGIVALARVETPRSEVSVLRQLQIGADELERVRRRIAPLVKILVSTATDRLKMEHCTRPVQAR